MFSELFYSRKCKIKIKFEIKYKNRYKIKLYEIFHTQFYLFGTILLSCNLFPLNNNFCFLSHPSY